MATKLHNLEIYEELAAWYDRQGQAKLRDWFLVLAADAAHTLDQHDNSERLRQRFLHANPHHLLRPFASFAEALESPDVRGYIGDLRRHYPLETAEQLLASTRKKPVPASTTAEHRDHTPLPRQDDRELKVYRAKEVIKEIPATPPRQQPKPPASTPKMPRPVAWTRPYLASNAPQTVELEVPPRDAREEDEESNRLSWWVATLLVGITALLGLGLALYVFVGSVLWSGA